MDQKKQCRGHALEWIAALTSWIGMILSPPSH